LDKSRHSVITEYMLSHTPLIGIPHSFNNIKILDSESNYNKRLISEILYIDIYRKQFNGINSQKDTEFLDNSYFCLFDILSNYH